MYPDGVHYLYASRRGAIASFPKNGGWQLGVSGMDTDRQPSGLRNPRTRDSSTGRWLDVWWLLRLPVAVSGARSLTGIITVMVPFDRKINADEGLVQKVADHDAGASGIGLTKKTLKKTERFGASPARLADAGTPGPGAALGSIESRGAQRRSRRTPRRPVLLRQRADAIRQLSTGRVPGVQRADDGGELRSAGPLRNPGPLRGAGPLRSAAAATRAPAALVSHPAGPGQPRRVGRHRPRRNRLRHRFAHR